LARFLAILAIFHSACAKRLHLWAFKENSDFKIRSLDCSFLIQSDNWGSGPYSVVCFNEAESPLYFYFWSIWRTDLENAY